MKIKKSARKCWFSIPIEN